LAIAIGMGAIFATSYSLFLGRATPHHITIGLVGSPAGHAALLVALRRSTHGGLAFLRYGTVAGVRQAIDQQVSFAGCLRRAATRADRRTDHADDWSARRRRRPASAAAI
jgi:hypothetical protein